MRLMLFVVGLSLVGCASSSEIRANGYAHAQKAAMLDAQGDYVGAAKERARANKQYAKANERAYYEQGGAYF